MQEQIDYHKVMVIGQGIVADQNVGEWWKHY